MAHHHGRDLRTGRVSIQGQVYLVTTVTYQRQPIFNNFSNARFVVNSLRYVEHTRQLQSLCFVIMPDHLHWLFSIGSTYELPQVISDIKRRSSYRINEQNKKIGSAVWQPGFHDYALRKEDEIKGVARYVIANPLRAGLVDNIGNYPFWDAVWL
ncbi:MAG: transposase [Proteobacteria bacterium]|nr:transposase [Pseudomonadota bacterium]